MLNKLIYRLMLAVSLFAVSTIQPVFSADKAMAPITAVMAKVEKININTATTDQFTEIKGIGAKKAQAIVDYRNTNGKFTSLKQLTNIKGIGEGILKKVEPFITL